jgi:hypothetical protein
MAKEKGVYTGLIEQDADGNFFCGPYMLDYKLVVSKFKIGDEVTVIENPSDKSYDKYPKKSSLFFLSNLKE